MTGDNESWKVWAEASVREVSQLRVDVNRHAAENREDMQALNGRLDILTNMVHELENARVSADHSQQLLIQELQIQARNAGREGGEASSRQNLIYIVISGCIAISLGVINLLRGQ